MPSAVAATGIALYVQPSASAAALVPSETTWVTGCGVTSLTASLPVAGFFVSGVDSSMVVGFACCVARYALAATTPASAVAAEADGSAGVPVLTLLLELLQADKTRPAAASIAGAHALFIKRSLHWDVRGWLCPAVAGVHQRLGRVFR